MTLQLAITCKKIFCSDALLASEYLNTKQVSTMYFPIFWRHFISKIVIRDTYWKKWGVFSTKIEF